MSGGTGYRFRATAHNVHGWGPVSTEALVYATDVPAQPATVTTTASTSNIEIAWTVPFNNYESIVAYRVAVQTSTGAFEEEPISCDASSTAIMDEMACRIPVATLVAGTFSLTAGDVVVAKVQAQNARGWGPLSVANTVGAIIITVPH